MDGRSLEDKILKYDLSRVPDDDAGPRPDSDAGSGRWGPPPCVPPCIPLILSLAASRMTTPSNSS